MKYICLGYIDAEKFGKALQPAGSIMTLRYTNGQGFVTDGPFAETKE